MRSKLKPSADQLNEKFLTENADVVDWDYAFMKMDLESLSDEFVVRFKENINLTALSNMMVRIIIQTGEHNTDVYKRVLFLSALKNKK